MKVYITRYALSDGILEKDAEECDRFPGMIETDKIKTTKALHFAKNNYMVANGIDYCGDATLVLYYCQQSNAEGDTVFSSHAYEKNSVAEKSKIPFKITTDSNGTLYVVKE